MYLFPNVARCTGGLCSLLYLHFFVTDVVSITNHLMLRYTSRYSSSLVLISLSFAFLISAQPPQSNGAGSQFLTPLSPEGLTPNPCSSIPTRELNGQCTSTRDPSWGQARFAQFSYLGRSSSTQPTGERLRSPREISNIVFEQRGDTVNSHGLNQLFVFFGQFIDHNFAATPTSDRESLNIPVTTADPVLNTRFLPFRSSVRGSADAGQSERPINTLSSAVDLAAVYSPNEERRIALSEFDGNGTPTGKLKTSSGNLLPLNSGQFVNAPDASARFFLAGDHRSNEHPVLTAIHTLFLREHNSLADEIKRRLPALPTRLVFEYARILNIAQFQKIVYEEFYPAIVGRELSLYQGFRQAVNPTLSDIFIGAAFRIGHTMVANEIPRRGPSGPLSPVRMPQVFFRQADTFSSDELNNVIRGTANTRAQEVDAQVVDALRNGLFENVRGEEGFDLIALNIQRGRDHALPTFNAIRRIFRIPEARRFEDISSDPSTVSKLSRAYNGMVEDVEAFVGLLAEDRARGSGMGRTMIAVWDEEFRRLRDGDQFFYARTSKLPNIVRRSFADLVRRLSIRGGVTFRDIILRNSGVTADQLPRGEIFKTGGSAPQPPPTPDPSAPSRSPTPSPRPTPSRTPTPSPSRGGRVVRGNYCGTTFGDSLTCHAACPRGIDSECPRGERCFASVPCSTQVSSAPSRRPAPRPTNYCGESFRNALSCRDPCPRGIDSECPSRQRCFALVPCS